MTSLAVLTSDLSPVRAEHDPRLRAAITAALPTLGRFVADLRGLGALVVHLHTGSALIPPQRRPGLGRRGGPAGLPLDGVGRRPDQVPQDAGRPGDLLLRGCPPARCCSAGVGAALRRRGAAEVVLLGAHHLDSLQAVATDLWENGFRVLVPREGLLAPSRADQVRALRALAASCASVMSMARIVTRAQAGSSPAGR